MWFGKKRSREEPDEYPEWFGRREGLIALPGGVTSWRKAETNAVVRLRALGYGDAQITRPGMDTIDIEASHMVGQVKMEGKPVTKPRLASLVGVHAGGSREMWYFSLSGYTKPALQFADEQKILLFEYNAMGELEPSNEIAALTLQKLLIKRVHRLQKQIQGRERWLERFDLTPRYDLTLRAMNQTHAKVITQLGNLVFRNLPEESRACAALDLLA